MTPLHAGAVPACVRNVCWVPLLVLHIFYIFRLDHLTSTPILQGCCGPERVLCKPFVADTKSYKVKGFVQEHFAQLCTTHVPKSMLLARCRSHCCAACVSPVSNNVQFPWAAFEPLWQLVSPSSFSCIKDAETGGRTKM